MAGSTTEENETQQHLPLVTLYVHRAFLPSQGHRFIPTCFSNESHSRRSFVVFNEKQSSGVEHKYWKPLNAKSGKWGHRLAKVGMSKGLCYWICDPAPSQLIPFVGNYHFSGSSVQQVTTAPMPFITWIITVNPRMSKWLGVSKTSEWMPHPRTFEWAPLRSWGLIHYIKPNTVSLHKTDL